MTDDDSNLVTTYLRHRAENRDEDWWAWEEVHEMAREEPHKAFQIVLQLLEAASTKEEISYIAAGPLEDLMNYNGKAVFAKFKEEIRLNKRLRYAFSMANVQTKDSETNHELAKIFAQYNLKDRDRLDI